MLEIRPYRQHFQHSAFRIRRPDFGESGCVLSVVIFDSLRLFLRAAVILLQVSIMYIGNSGFSCWWIY